MDTDAPVTIRPIEFQDMEQLRRLLNDPEIALTVVDFGLPVSAEQQREWFRNVHPHENADRFMIEAAGVAVGSVVAARIDAENLVCEVGYKIEKAHQGHGYAARAVLAVLRHLFTVRGMECVTAYYLPGNAASRRVLERAGFSFEGTVRGAAYRNGERTDLVYWSITREEYFGKAGEADAAEG